MKRLFGFVFRLTPFRISLLMTAAVLTLMLFGAHRHIPALEILDLFELKVYDFRLLVRGPQPASDEIVIVDIDDKTLDDLGRWPFSRSRMGDAVENLARDGAKVISWDVLFSEEDKNSELLKLREIRGLLERTGLAGTLPPEDRRSILHAAAMQLDQIQKALDRLQGRLSANLRARLLRELELLGRGIRDGRVALGQVNERLRKFYDYIVEAESRANNDAYFARKISEAGNVVLGYFFHDTTEAIGYMAEIPVEQRERLIEPSRITILQMPAGYDGPLPGWPVYQEIEPNIPIYSAATPHFGSFTIQQDLDGTIRKYPLVVNFRRRAYYPSLALKTLSLYFDAPPIVRVADGGFGIEQVRIGSRTIPVDENGLVLINYRGPGNVTFPKVSFSDVVNGNFAPGTFKDRIALIGPTAIGIMDLRVTPFDQDMPGVEVHANVMDNILSGQFYQKPTWMKIFDVLAVLLIGLALGVFMAPLNALTIGFVGIGIAAAYVFGGQWLLENEGIWLTTVYPVVNVALCSAGIILYKYYTEERQKKEIRSAFQTYLSPAVVEQVIADPSKLALGGEKRELTVLFSDVRGFTTISEALDAEELASLLNEYLTPMTDLVFKHGGTLDKYMGDAIMAFWGAPIPQEDHAFRACDCALEMMRVLHELQRDFEARGYPPIDIGIGINTGPMSVGNMGSTQRMDYTVMGDAVNLGSRLEGINKTYGTHIIISEFTYRACEGQIWCRELDLVAVKGKKEPVRIYELIDYKPVPTLVPLVNRFHEALQMYREGDFARAFQMFQDILRDYPTDGPSRTFLERSRELLENPPESWNGVYVAKTK